MALTGVAGQAYSLGNRPPTAESLGGPAFLVYYSPAFLRQVRALFEGGRAGRRGVLVVSLGA